MGSTCILCSAGDRATCRYLPPYIFMGEQRTPSRREKAPMKKHAVSYLIIIAFAAALLIVTGRTRASAEYLFLRSGPIVEGRIVNESGGGVTVINRKTGRSERYANAAILRVLYTPIYLGKVFIRLANGKSLEAYVVEEDNEKFVLRDKIDSPEEYTLKREEVLFMTRSNPTGLAGRPYEKSLRLTWNAPYRTPRYYNVYVKKAGPARHKKVASSITRSHTVRGLERKTTYYVYVTAIDREGKESVPSNEITIKTNEPPGAPTNGLFSVVKQVGNRFNIMLTWKPAVDRDGRVVKYAVYDWAENREKKLGETSVTTFRGTGLNAEATHYFSVRSIDEDGYESEDSLAISSIRKIGLNFEGRFVFAYPVGDLAKMCRYGLGGMGAFYINKPAIRYVDLGVEAGYLAFTPNNFMIRGYTMVPILLAARYRIPVREFFYLGLGLAGGVSHTTLKHGTRFLYNGMPVATWRTERSFQPMGRAELVLGFTLRETLLLTARFGYAAIIEKSGLLGFVYAEAGIGVRF